jgi:DNA-binding transcriptional regulator YiaG
MVVNTSVLCYKREMVKKITKVIKNRGAQLLYRWRWDKNLRQRDACKLFDCDQTQMSNWECGRVKPERKMAVIIERITMGAVTCASWDDEPLAHSTVDPILNPSFDPHMHNKAGG